MAGFRYQALDSAGRKALGVLEADSPRQARTLLRAQGLTPVEIETIAADVGAREGTLGRRRRLGTTALALLTRQLSTLLGASLTIEQALSALIEQSAEGFERQLLGAIRADVLAGQSLAKALGNQGVTFPEIYRTLVDAGERSGKLPEVLERLADYTEDRDNLRSKVMLAFIYPSLVLIVATVVVVALLTYVVPQVVQVFRNTQQALPLLTRGLIALSDALRATWPVLLALVAAGTLIIARALRVPALRERWHRVQLELPLAGPLVRGLNTARLASTLAILTASRVPLLVALQAGAGVVSNLPMRHALEKAGLRVQEGSTLARALGASGLFPPLMVHMIASGEASGRLAELLERTATQQSRELERRTTALMALLEPVMILTMGVVVLLIVLAILMPIFEMNQIIR